MKTKRFLSLLLAVVMSFSMAVPVFAAKPQAFPQKHISLSSGGSVGPFAVTPGSGKYLQVWFRNFSGAEVTVMLMNESNTIVLKAMTVKKNSGAQNKLVYPLLDPNLPTKYYIRFQAEGGAQVVGDVAAAQYDNLTARPGEGEPAPLVRMPVRLFENGFVDGRTGTYETNKFTTTPGNGRYIDVWYYNDTDDDVTINLYRTDKTGPVSSVKASHYNSYRVIWYTGSNTEAVTYYIRVEGKNHAPVSGCLLVTQDLYLYDDPLIKVGSGSHRTSDFSLTPGNGKYIKVWYENKADHDVNVFLRRENDLGYVDYITVKANGGTNVMWCPVSDTEPVSYHVQFASKNSYPLLGHLRVTEEAFKTN